MKTGDSVRIMRGDRKGFEGKITSVDRGNYRILIEGVTREKVDGSTIQIPIHPSKVMLTNLDTDDKWRREALKRRIASPQKPAEAPAPPPTSKEGKKETEKPRGRRRAARKPGRKSKKKAEPAKSTPQKSKKSTKAPKTRRRKTTEIKAKEGDE